MAITLIVVGALIFATGVYYHFYKPSPVLHTSLQAATNTVSATKVSGKAIDRENIKKGYAFEQYVRSKIRDDYFNVLVWRGDKSIDGKTAASNSDPDFEVRFINGAYIDTFAVECKWRKAIYNGALEWTNEGQLARYRRFAKDRNMPVFIAIGVGGEPSSPEKVYVIPLDDIEGIAISRQQLEKYYKNPETNFYWHMDTKKLT